MIESLIHIVKLAFLGSQSLDLVTTIATVWLILSHNIFLVIIIGSTIVTVYVVALAELKRLRWQNQVDIVMLRTENQLLLRAFNEVNAMHRTAINDMHRTSLNDMHRTAHNDMHRTAAAAGKTPAVSLGIAWDAPRIVSPYSTPRLASATPRPVSPPTATSQVSADTLDDIVSADTVDDIVSADVNPDLVGPPAIEYIGCFPPEALQIREAFFASEAKFVVYTCRLEYTSITIINRSWCLPRRGALLACGVVIEMLPATAISKSYKLKRLIPAVQGYATTEKGISKRVLEAVQGVSTPDEQHKLVAERVHSLLSSPGDIEEAWAQLWPGPMPF